MTRCGRDARRGLAALSCGAVLAIECALGLSFVACSRGGRTLPLPAKQAPTAEPVKLA